MKLGQRGEFNFCGILLMLFTANLQTFFYKVTERRNVVRGTVCPFDLVSQPKELDGLFWQGYVSFRFCPPCSVAKVDNCKQHFRNWLSFHLQVKKWDVTQLGPLKQSSSTDVIVPANWVPFQFFTCRWRRFILIRSSVWSMVFPVLHLWNTRWQIPKAKYSHM